MINIINLYIHLNLICFWTLSKYSTYIGLILKFVINSIWIRFEKFENFLVFQFEIREVTVTSSSDWQMVEAIVNFVKVVHLLWKKFPIYLLLIFMSHFCFVEILCSCPCYNFHEQQYFYDTLSCNWEYHTDNWTYYRN